MRPNSKPNIPVIEHILTNSNTLYPVSLQSKSDAANAADAAANIADSNSAAAAAALTVAIGEAQGGFRV